MQYLGGFVRREHFAIALMAAAVVGCAEAPTDHWVKAGATEKETSTAKGECTQESVNVMSYASGAHNPSVGEKACMEAKGWHQQP
jgi:hypothetical protein